MEPILEAKKLNLWYGPNHALHDVSIAIPNTRSPPSSGPPAAENLPFCGR